VRGTYFTRLYQDARIYQADPHWDDGGNSRCARWRRAYRLLLDHMAEPQQTFYHATGLLVQAGVDTGQAYFLGRSSYAVVSCIIDGRIFTPSFYMADKDQNGYTVQMPDPDQLIGQMLALRTEELVWVGLIACGYWEGHRTQIIGAFREQALVDHQNRLAKFFNW